MLLWVVTRRARGIPRAAGEDNAAWALAVDGTARVLLGDLSEEGSARIQRDLGGDDLFEFARQGGTQSVVCVDDSV
jgi:hypothetical protein